ncbi:methyl-accepting chemotaxis protein [Spirochaetota bacterium]
MKSGIRAKAFLFLIIGPLVLTSVLAIMLFFVDYNKDMRNSRTKLEAQANGIRDIVYMELSKGLEVLRVLSGLPLTSRVVAQMPEIPHGLDNDDYNHLSEVQELKEFMDYATKGSTLDLVYVASTGSSGLILGRDVQLVEGFDVRLRDYYKAAVEKPGTAVISEPRISAEQSVVPIIVITAARSIENARGTTIGVAAYNYQLTPIIDIIKKQIEAYGVEVSFYDTMGAYMLWDESNGEEYYFKPGSPLLLSEFLEAYGYQKDEAGGISDKLLSRNTEQFELEKNGSKYMAVSLSIPGTRWSLLIKYPRQIVVNELIRAILPPVIIFFLSFMLAEVLIFMLTLRYIIRPLSLLGGHLADLALADADLTIRIPEVSRDEIGSLARNFNEFIEKLRTLMLDLRKAIEVSTSVKESISSSIEETSSSTEEISANLSSIRKQIEVLDNNMDETLRLIKAVGSNIGKVDEQIIGQSAMVEQSTSAVTQMIASLGNVNGIAQSKRNSTQQLASLAASSKETITNTANTFKSMAGYIVQIEEMATAINDIASQTNLLSMNAAIEAAHAGDSGRGFAVVAEEIRKLAGSAADSSRGISTLVKDISNAVKETGENVVLSSEAFENIAREINSTVNAFREIEESVAELNAGGKQILDAMNEINDVTVNIKERSQEVYTDTNRMVESSSDIKEISGRVSLGIGEAAQGSQEIVSSVQLMVSEAHQLNKVIGELTEKFGKFKTE